MGGAIETRLRDMGLSVPSIPAPDGNFLPYTRDGSLVFLAGQTNEVNGVPTLTGKIPAEHSIAAGQAAARVCALNLLAALKHACDGDLDRVERCLSMRGFVNASPGFAKTPLVINGASDLFIALFGEAGRHARTAVGVAALPENAAVEVDAIFKLRG